jgi:hypothetical protein
VTDKDGRILGIGKDYRDISDRKANRDRKG